MPLGQGGPHERGGEKGVAPLKRRHFAGIDTLLNEVKIIDLG